MLQAGSIADDEAALTAVQVLKPGKFPNALTAQWVKGGCRPQGGDISERLDNLARKTVHGRVGQPEEIAHAIYFLADETQSSFMTGQALIIDGGATARLSTE